MRAVLAHDAQAQSRARRHLVVCLDSRATGPAGNHAWSGIPICLAGTPGQCPARATREVRQMDRLVFPSRSTGVRSLKAVRTDCE